jgi:hypothetical protein
LTVTNSFELSIWISCWWVEWSTASASCIALCLASVGFLSYSFPVV